MAMKIYLVGLYSSEHYEQISIFKMYNFQCIFPVTSLHRFQKFEGKRAPEFLSQSFVLENRVIREKPC
jgi:hypothetical protein